MNRRLRISWVMATPSLAGGVKSNRLIAEAMVRRGHEVRIVYPATGPAWPMPWRVRRFWRRLRRELQPGSRRHHLEQSQAQLIPVDHNPVRAEDVPDGDVVIASWWKTRQAIESWPVSRGIKVHFVRHHELHGGEPEQVRGVYRLPGLKLAIARWLERIMIEDYGAQQTALIPNGVDRAQFDAPPRDRQAVPAVGMLYGPQDWKGAPTAFEALRIVQQTIPQLRVVAFGRAAILPEHVQPANIEYHQRPAQSVIPRLYASTDCWVVPSTHEGFGMPGLEAAACRCPIVSTRCGGPEDYVHDGRTGRLVPVGDARAMADAIIGVLKLDDAAWRAMSLASYDLSHEFDWDKSAQKLERVLYEALDRSTVVQRAG